MSSPSKEDGKHVGLRLALLAEPHMESGRQLSSSVGLGCEREDLNL